MAKRYKGFKNKRKYRAGKKKIKNQLRIALKDKKVSKRELKKIRSKAKKSGYQGSSKRLAKLIKRSSKKIKPKAFKKGNVRGVATKKNTRRLKAIKNSKPQTPFYGPLKDPTKRPPKTNFPNLPGPKDLRLPFKPEIKAPKEPEIFTPEAHVDPAPSPTPPTPAPEPVRLDTPPPAPTPAPEPPKPATPTPAPEINWAALLKASQDTNNLLTRQLSQPRQTAPAPSAPTINVQMPEMPETEEALTRAKSTSSYLSGGSAGGVRRRRSNRSKLGLSGLGTNQLNRNVSNLLSIRGISV